MRQIAHIQIYKLSTLDPNPRYRITASKQFPTGAFSSEKESDGGSNTLTSCVNVVKRHVEINLIEDQNIESNKLFEMVREHNLTTYTLLAAMVYQV